MSVLVALLVGALLVLWVVVELAVRLLAWILVGGLVLIALIYFGLRRMFKD